MEWSTVLAPNPIGFEVNYRASSQNSYCGFLGTSWAGMLSFLFSRDSNFRGKNNRGRGNTGLHTASQRTTIHTFSGAYKEGGNFSEMPLNSGLSTKDI